MVEAALRVKGMNGVRTDRNMLRGTNRDAGAIAFCSAMGMVESRRRRRARRSSSPSLLTWWKCGECGLWMGLGLGPDALKHLLTD